MPIHNIVLLIHSFMFSGWVIAGECAFLDESKGATELVWPYLSNATITGVFEDAVSLHAGQYSGAPFILGGHARPELRLWPELLISADLDGNAGDEKIGLLSETSGGSGERVYLAVVRAENGQFQVLPAVLLGDRIQIRSLEVHDRQIVLKIVEAGTGQPFSRGTQLSQLKLRVENGKVVIKKRELQGELSLSTIQGKDWYLLDRPGDRTNALHPSCMRLNIQGNRAGLVVDGKMYTAKVSETVAGHLAFTELMPELEFDQAPGSRLINDLMDTTNYTFRAGRLLLSGKVKGRWLTLEFASIPAMN